jgi:phytoene dehydrogenase-like protein
VSSSYYDVIVLGADLAPLFCAALLARRGFRVLVLGHEYLPPTYVAGGYRLAYYPFTFIGANAPSARRLFAELGIYQRFRRIAQPTRRPFQVVLPGHRLDISADAAELEREMSREFPNLKRPIEEFHQHIAQLSEQFDQVAAGDLIWPPETFLERREFTRSISRLAFDRFGKGRDLLAECPEGHPFRLAARLPSYFSSSIDPDQTNAFALARLYANWRHGAAVPEGGLRPLRDLLLEKIRSHSGIVRLDERVRARKSVVTLWSRVSTFPTCYRSYRTESRSRCCSNASAIRSFVTTAIRSTLWHMLKVYRSAWEGTCSM